MRWLAVEALTAGLAYGAGLGWVSVCLVASFRPDGLSAPYWWDLPGLRTDTSGIIAFFVLAVCLAASEYLRLRRRQDAPVTLGPAWAGGTARPLALAISETVALLATGLAGHAPGGLADGRDVAGGGPAPVRGLGHGPSLPVG
jgi:hypothetical protein